VEERKKEKRLQILGTLARGVIPGQLHEKSETASKVVFSGSLSEVDA